jgi:hypothetical protein
MSSIVIAGDTSGSVTLQAPAVAGSSVLSLPAVTDTVVGIAATQTLTNKTLVAPALGTPVSGNLSNCTGIPAGSAATPTALGTVYGLTPIAGAQNVSIGYNVLNAITTGVGNVGFGLNTLQSNTTGQENSAFGGTYFSEAPLKLNTTGSNNCAFGASALRTNTTGSNNVAYGVGALSLNTTASNNTGLGYEALRSNTTASNNTAVGYQAGYANTTGADNTLIGYLAGDSITTGNRNVVLGRSADTSAAGGIDQIVIGYAAVGKGNDTFTNNATNSYNGGNTTTWATISDQRLKKNIVDNSTGLNEINKIQVRNFEYRLSEEVTELPQDQAIEKTGVQLGVIAQELQQILPECVKTESTGVMTVDTDNLTWYLVNAVKELTARVKQLEGN